MAALAQQPSVGDRYNPLEATLAPTATAMNDRDNHPLHATLNAYLAEIVAAAGTRPSWHEAWSQLGPESSEERIRRAVH